MHQLQIAGREKLLIGGWTAATGRDVQEMDRISANPITPSTILTRWFLLVATDFASFASGAAAAGLGVRSARHGSGASYLRCRI